MTLPSPRRFWNEDLFVYELGLKEKSFVELAKQYKPYMAKLDLERDEETGKLLQYVQCEADEDETAILADLRWSHRRDSVIGSCGTEGAHHQCNEFCSVKLGDDAATEGKINDVCDNGVRASYARLVVCNPLHPDLPALAIQLSPTCNRFDHKYVDGQWDRLQEMWDKHLTPLGLLLVGHGSDGDSRRFKLQKEKMTTLPNLTTHEQFRLDHEGFTLYAVKDRKTGVNRRG